MDVSENSGIPKLMVYNLSENPIKMDDLGGTPLFSETPIFMGKKCSFHWRVKLIYTPRWTFDKITELQGFNEFVETSTC